MDQFKMNRIANCRNQFQGKFKRVLCLCSAGLLRSPTAAFVLSQEPFNYNTRCAGLTPEFALIPSDDVLFYWADEIVCMDQRQVKVLMENDVVKKREISIICLDIPDNFAYREPALIELIKKNYGDPKE